MANPDLQALAREARRDLPPDAACAVCGERRHLRPAPDGRLRCYACRRAERGAGPTEGDHHLAGRRNLGSLTLRLRANDHRTVTELRTRVGLDEWPDAEGDPLLVVAHFLAGMATLLLLVAEWLVDAAAHLAAELGADVWEGARPAPMVP